MGWFDELRSRASAGSMDSAVALSASMSASPDAPLVRVSDQPFKAARRGRASAGFEGQRQHINSAIRQGGALLRERSRFMCRENGLAISSKEIWTAYAVGTGILPMPVGLTAARKRALLQSFYDWAQQSDFDGQADFFGQTAQVSDESFEVGEIFVRKIISADKPLQLQMLASEQLPYNVVSPAGKVAGNVVRLGIEFEGAKRVAYHFYIYHPGDATVSTRDRLRTERIPADEILHVYKVRTPGQLRGLPRTLGALIPGNKLDEYDDALIERAISGSKVSGIITKGASDRESGTGALGGSTDNKDGTATLDFEVGTILELEQDETWNTVEPPDPGANYGEFVYRQTSKACAAMGVPYLEATGDLRRAPYSAGRLGRMPFKRRIEQFQHLELVPQFLRPVWLAWLRDGLLRGTITLPRGSARTVEAYAKVNWMGPKWEYIEPLKDRQAEVLAVDNLLEARSDVVAQRGDDPDELDERIRDDQRREKRLKLVRPSAKVAAEKPTEDEDPSADEDEDEDEEGENK